MADLQALQREQRSNKKYIEKLFEKSDEKLNIVIDDITCIEDYLNEVGRILEELKNLGILYRENNKKLYRMLTEEQIDEQLDETSNFYIKIRTYERKLEKTLIKHEVKTVSSVKGITGNTTGVNLTMTKNNKHKLEEEFQTKSEKYEIKEKIYKEVEIEGKMQLSEKYPNVQINENIEIENDKFIKISSTNENFIVEKTETKVLLQKVNKDRSYSENKYINIKMIIEHRNHELHEIIEHQNKAKMINLYQHGNKLKINNVRNYKKNKPCVNVHAMYIIKNFKQRKRKY